MSLGTPPDDGAPHPAELEDADVVGHASEPSSRPAPQVRRAHEPSLKPPHSLDAEREVLAAAFIDSATVRIIASKLRSGHFFADRHRLVFEAVVDLLERGVAVDLVTTLQALSDRGTLERAGGIRTLSELLDRSGTVTNLEHYIAIVLDKARLRHIIDTARDIEARALGDVADVDAFVDEVATGWQRTIGEVQATHDIELLSVADRKDRGEDWLGEAPPEARILLRNRDGSPFARAQRVGAIVAPGGTGKTFALIDLALSIACGAPWLDTYRVEQRGKVFLGLGEEDDDEIRRRAHAIARRFGETDRQWVEENLFPKGFMGQRVSLMERGHDGNMVPSPWYRQLRETLEKHGPWRAIILDPWSRWGGPDAENDAHAATVGISLLESLLLLPGEPNVFVAHHTRKMVAGTKADVNNTRGSSAFIDGVRWSVELSKRGKSKLLQLEVTKTNNTVPGPMMVLSRGKGGTLRPASPVEIAEAEEMELAGRRRRSEGANSL